MEDCHPCCEETFSFWSFDILTRTLSSASWDIPCSHSLFIQCFVQPYFIVRCSPLASSVKLSFPPFYQPHPGEEMREKTTSRAVRRTCTSCHLSARSPLTAGITAPLSEGPESSPACKHHSVQGLHRCLAKNSGDVGILLQSGSCRMQPRRAPSGRRRRTGTQ